MRRGSLRLPVHRGLCELAQRPNGLAVDVDGGGRHVRPGRLIHERYEFVGEPGHGAANTHAADVRTAANPVHPAPLADVALDDRSPAAEFDDARFRAIFGGEVGLLVVPAAIAALVYGFGEQ